MRMTILTKQEWEAVKRFVKKNTKIKRDGDPVSFLLKISRIKKVEAVLNALILALVAMITFSAGYGFFDSLTKKMYITSGLCFLIIVVTFVILWLVKRNLDKFRSS